MRAIRKPDNYVTAKRAAAMLREIADTVERKADSWHSVYVTIASATAEEIEAARERARAKAGRALDAPAGSEAR